MHLRILAGLLLVLARPLAAQTAEQLLTQAREAFENLDFEGAARLYTRVLDVSTGTAEAQRDTAQLYLGVSYEFAGQRTDAVSAFRTFVRSNPCAPTPDQFGASVTAAFVEARGSVFAVGVCAIRSQRLARGDAATFRVAVTHRAMVRAVLQDSAGRTVADLGEQPAASISEIRWSQLPDPAAFGTAPVRYSLLVRARAFGGLVSFMVGNGRRDLPENRAYNLQLRERWTAARDSVVAVNLERLGRRPLVIEPVEPR